MMRPINIDHVLGEMFEDGPRFAYFAGVAAALPFVRTATGHVYVDDDHIMQLDIHHVIMHSLDQIQPFLRC